MNSHTLNEQLNTLTKVALQPSDALFQLTDRLATAKDEAAKEKARLQEKLKTAGLKVSEQMAEARRLKEQEAVSRQAIAGLMAQMDPDEIVWKPLDGSPPVTAQQMMDDVREGTDRGRSYATDLMKVARDILLRKARTQ